MLGYVGDIVLDIEDHYVLQYEVKSSMLSTKKHMIARGQVLSVTAEKMIVEVAVVHQQEERLKMGQGDMGNEAIAMREDVS